MDHEEPNVAVESAFPKTKRSKLRRMPARGTTDKAAVYRVLDEGLVCHLGFEVEGQPFVIPTGYGRKGDTVYIHGSNASRMLKGLRSNPCVCLTVTLLDGIVVARSLFHSSMNYRTLRQEEERTNELSGKF